MSPFFHPYPECSPSEVGASTPFNDSDLDKYTYDYIVVGGGSAGSCLASRLSETPGVSVLVVERGQVLDTWSNRVPLISANFFREDSPAALFPAEPLAHANNRVLDIVAGEGLGGTSRINGCLYARGLRGDWNRWNRPGWSYDELIPYFIKSENTLSQQLSSFRGKKGTWINQVMPDMPRKILRKVFESGKALGIPVISDINAPDAPAVASVVVDYTIDQHIHRMSTFSAFLPKQLALARKSHLKICTKTIVTRVAISKAANENRADGVYLQTTSGSTKEYFARARKEVILCSGAIASPQLLLLSGIGPKSYLEQEGINVAFDSPGVGTQLHDHYAVAIGYDCPNSESLTTLIQNPLRIVVELLKYLFLGSGVLAYPFMQFALFIRTALINSNGEVDTSRTAEIDGGNPDNTPDVEIMLCPHHVLNSPKDTPSKTGVFSFLVALIRPHSIGSVRLASKDPRDRAKVQLNYLDHPDDMKTLTTGVRFAERLAEGVRHSGYPLGNIRNPSTSSPAEFDTFLRENIRSAYHFTSTCRMAPLSDPRPGVVDDELRVHGVSGLRVCDTSIFTEPLATHTMAPAVVTAEKLADILKSHHKN